MAAMSNLCLIFIFGFSLVVQIQNSVAAFDYGSALTKSLLFFEAQRSGKLPSNQRANWRGNSALKDGWDAGANLVGGYYDAGDNLKFGFPMAYTMTMLAWSVVEFGSQLRAQHEFSNALAALKWGTDYLIKAHPWPEVLYGQVGEGVADHACWQRPEDMTTPRTVYMIDDKHPGSDLAGETAAALAAAAVAFQKSNPTYASELIKHAKQLFEFATYHRGLYTNTIPAGQYYQSSGDADELLWAAAWLRQATNDNRYLEFIKSANSGGARDTFSWDDKYVGAYVLITKDVLQGKIPRNGNIDQMKKDGEEFVCNCMQKGNKNVRKTNGGVLWFNQWNNLQYVTSASFILTTYANILTKSKTSIQCSGGAVWPKEMLAMAKSQVDYILGDNPKGMSYMVGYGSNYPKQVHHRAASIVSMKKNSKTVGCQEGFDLWFHRRDDNPNVLEGAIVGGPDESDQYKDERENYQQAEPATANNAPIVGVLASLATWNKF